VRRITHRVGSVYVSVTVFLGVISALVVGVALGFPPWCQTMVYSTSGLVALSMLFMIQPTTNQQTATILLKLDELVHASSDARNEVMDAGDDDRRSQEQLHDRLHH